MLLRIFNKTPNFALSKYNKIGFYISIASMVLSIGLVIFRGLNLGVDFTGGLLIEAKFPEVVKMDQLRAKLSNARVGEISLQEFGSPDTVLIRVGIKDKSETKTSFTQITNTVKGILGAGAEIRRSEFVGPTIGSELLLSGLYAAIGSLIAMGIYVWFRFEWHFSIGALMAELHDVILTFGFFALFQIEFNTASIAAILTIVGYSINDTVVVYDRMRENIINKPEENIIKLLDLSLNETISRTILTSFTTAVVLLVLLIFGGDIISDFALVMLFGVLVGTWSSIYVACPMLVFANLSTKSLIKSKKQSQADNFGVPDEFLDSSYKKAIDSVKNNVNKKKRK